MESGSVTFHSESIRAWEAPSPKAVGETVEEFLQILKGPTWLRLPGYDQTRTRAISTLLHGNEPSGVRALFNYIRSGEQPAVDLVCFVGAVEAALASTGFAHRHLPGHKDLNRCFREPFDSSEGQIAHEVLKRFREAKPDALIDLHNTSGRSPAYGVTTQLGEVQKTITSLFSHHLIYTELRLGSLMEATEFDFPTITIECGGAGDPASDRIAWEGLTRYARTESVLDLEPALNSVIVFQHPVRVELCQGMRVSYGRERRPDADLTMYPDVDRHNFGIVNAGEVLGWLGPPGLEVLCARDSNGKDLIHEIFHEQSGSLVVSQPGHILMMTIEPHIAMGDCLFYWIPVNEREIKSCEQ